MNKIERKKLIFIIAGLITLVVVGLMITLSMFTNGNSPDPEKTQQPEPTETSSSPSPSDQEEDTVPIIGVDEEDAPPADMYENDYSQDSGYVKLPDGFDGSTPEGTVYDPEWMYTKFNILLCELSTKQSSTEEALKPLKDFNDDLALAQTEEASTARSAASRYIGLYEDTLGERVDGSTRAELSVYCDMEDIDNED